MHKLLLLLCMLPLMSKSYCIKSKQIVYNVIMTLLLSFDKTLLNSDIKRGNFVWHQCKALCKALVLDYTVNFHSSVTQ